MPGKLGSVIVHFDGHELDLDVNIVSRDLQTAHQAVRPLFKKCFYIFSSLRLTLCLIIFLIILLIIGTVSQIELGALVVQEKIFRSLFIYWEPRFSQIKIPVFPGGYLLGFFLAMNLACSLAINFKFSSQKLGIYLIHFSLIFFIIGEAVIGILASESLLPIQEGERKNQSIELEKLELSIEEISRRAALQPPGRLLPFSIELTKFTHENYPGTDLPKNFSSLLKIYSTEGKYMRSAFVSMNNPFRYKGLTLYQAGFGKDNKESILKIVENPVSFIPYLCSCLIIIGLIYQFSAFTFFS